jgi:hypothetical protein
MLLRASGQLRGADFDLHAVTETDASSGVPHGEVLTAFAEASVRGSDEERAAARDAIEQALCPEAVVDAAGVVANFERMVRIADATGIPLDKPIAVFSTGMREELGIDDFGASANTPPVGIVLRTLGRLAQPLIRPIMSLYSDKK